MIRSKFAENKYMIGEHIINSRSNSTLGINYSLYLNCEYYSIESV